MQRIRKDVLYPELSYIICGMCFEAHNSLGRFRRERSYADFLERLLKERSVVYVREPQLPASFYAESKGRNRPDFIVSDEVVVDLKAKRVIEKSDYMQMQRYLMASGKELGLIVNFGQRYVSVRRVLRQR